MTRLRRDAQRGDLDHSPPPMRVSRSPASALLDLQRTVGNSVATTLLRGPDGRWPWAELSAQRQEQTDGAKPAAHPTLREGDTGESVVEAQARLNAAGAPSLVVDGLFGPKTRGGVVSFQRDRTLLADGIVGPQTWGALDAGNPIPDNPLECGCLAADEEADVFETTPDAELDGIGGQPSAQTLAVQRDKLDVQRDTKAPTRRKKPATAGLAACSADAKACFSVSQRRAWLLKPGKVVQTEVSALGGRKGHPTPIGKFTVADKDADHHSSKYKDPKTGKGAPMPNYVHFAPQVGFHAGSLSTESHGCVHLAPGDSKTFFDNLNKGDRVDVVP